MALLIITLVASEWIHKNNVLLINFEKWTKKKQLSENEIEISIESSKRPEPTSPQGLISIHTGDLASWLFGWLVI